MDVSAVICSDSLRLGEWIEIDLPQETSLAHLQQLLALYGGALPMRQVGDGLQVFCPRARAPAEVMGQMHQLLADIALRERIAKRCVIQMDALVEGVLCRVLKV